MDTIRYERTGYNFGAAMPDDKRHAVVLTHLLGEVVDHYSAGRLIVGAGATAQDVEFVGALLRAINVELLSGHFEADEEATDQGVADEHPP